MLPASGVSSVFGQGVARTAAIVAALLAATERLAAGAALVPADWLGTGTDAAGRGLASL